jgi:hypothetical protein
MKTTKIRTIEGAKLVNPVHIFVYVDKDTLTYDIELAKIAGWNLACKIGRGFKKLAKVVGKAAKYMAEKTVENIQYDLEFYPEKMHKLADAWSNKWWPALKLDFALLKFNLSSIMSKIPLSHINVGEIVINVKNQFLLLVDDLTKYKRGLDNDSSDMYQLLLCMMNDN